LLIGKTLLVFGGRSTAVEIAEAANRFFAKIFPTVKLVIKDSSDHPQMDHIKESKLKQFVEAEERKPDYIISMWNQIARKKCIKLAEFHGLEAASLTHPKAYVSNSALIGKGVYIGANSVVSSNAIIRDHVIVNFNVTVGHDSLIGSNTLINPGARISGNVTIGERVLVGSNAFIFQGKKVGSDTLIDALTYIDRDITNNMICSSKKIKYFNRIQ